MRPTSIEASARDSKNCQPEMEWSAERTMEWRGWVEGARRTRGVGRGKGARTVVSEFVQRIVADNDARLEYLARGTAVPLAVVC